MDALCLLEIARKDAAEAGESDYAALIEKVIAQLKEDLKELDSLRKTWDNKTMITITYEKIKDCDNLTHWAFTCWKEADSKGFRLFGVTVIIESL